MKKGRRPCGALAAIILFVAAPPATRAASGVEIAVSSPEGEVDAALQSRIADSVRAVLGEPAYSAKAAACEDLRIATVIGEAPNGEIDVEIAATSRKCGNATQGRSVSPASAPAQTRALVRSILAGLAPSSQEARLQATASPAQAERPVQPGEKKSKNLWLEGDIGALLELHDYDLLRGPPGMAIAGSFGWKWIGLELGVAAAINRRDHPYDEDGNRPDVAYTSILVGPRLVSPTLRGFSGFASGLFQYVGYGTYGRGMAALGGKIGLRYQWKISGVYADAALSGVTTEDAPATTILLVTAGLFVRFPL
jgi:hypothetical protein